MVSIGDRMGFPSFNFGDNWKSYSRLINSARLSDAQHSLVDFIGEDNIRGKTFLDSGCGSGIFTIAACEIGAKKVVGIDIDPVSVEISRYNAEMWMPGKDISVMNLSVLDEDGMRKLGQFDLVYSWGVLHHTGNLYQAIKNAADRVRTGGIFMLAIYNQHFTSGIWKVIKRVYNVVPEFIKIILKWTMVPVIFLAKLIVTEEIR